MTHELNSTTPLPPVIAAPGSHEEPPPFTNTRQITGFFSAATAAGRLPVTFRMATAAGIPLLLATGWACAQHKELLIATFFLSGPLLLWFWARTLQQWDDQTQQRPYKRLGVLAGFNALFIFVTAVMALFIPFLVLGIMVQIFNSFFPSLSRSQLNDWLGLSFFILQPIGNAFSTGLLMAVCLQWDYPDQPLGRLLLRAAALSVRGALSLVAYTFAAPFLFVGGILLPVYGWFRLFPILLTALPLLYRSLEEKTPGGFSPQLTE